MSQSFHVDIDKPEPSPSTKSKPQIKRVKSNLGCLHNLLGHHPIHDLKKNCKKNTQGVKDYEPGLMLVF